MVLLIVVLVIVVVLVGGVLAYKGLVRKRNRTQEAWSEIDVELKRRHDLIPNLVERSRPTPAASTRRTRTGGSAR